MYFKGELRQQVVDSEVCKITADQLTYLRPPKVQNVMLTKMPDVTEIYENHERTVFVSISFNWTRPVITYGSLDGYEVYLGEVDMLRRQPTNTVSNTEARQYK